MGLPTFILFIIINYKIMENRQAQIPIQNIQNMLNDIRRRYPTTYRPAFQSLNQCLSNIIQHPDEVSYRIINLIDHFIQNNILIIPEILDILRLIGFSQTQPGNRNILIYQDQPLNVLNNYISIFNNFLAQAQSPQPQNQRTFQDPRMQNRNLPNPSRPNNEQKYRMSLICIIFLKIIILIEIIFVID